MRSDATDELLAEIDAFLAEAGMGDSYFGKRAVGNSELVPRLRVGRGCLLQTAERARRFIRDERARRVNSPPGCASEGRAPDAAHPSTAEAPARARSDETVNPEGAA